LEPRSFGSSSARVPRSSRARRFRCTRSSGVVRFARRSSISPTFRNLTNVISS
jgi:hypothetical protein